MADSDFKNPLATVTLFHESGAAVTLPVEIEGDTPLEAYKWAYQCVSDAIAAGFKVNAPGLEEGEQVEEVGYVVRGNFEKDGEETPYLLLYSVNDRMEYSFLKVYLNSDSDITAFQAASGMKLQDIPTYIGQDKPKRGASKQIDKFIVKVPRPFKVVLKKNPKYDEKEAAEKKAKNETYTVPARLFVRWETGGKTAPQQAQQKPEFDAQEEIKRWTQFLLSDPPLDLMSEKIKEAAKVKGLIKVINHLVEDWKTRTGAWWDKDKGHFMPAKEDEPEADPGYGGDDPIPF